MTADTGYKHTISPHGQKAEAQTRTNSSSAAGSTTTSRSTNADSPPTKTTTPDEYDFDDLPSGRRRPISAQES